MGGSSQGASWGRGPRERRASGRTAHRHLVLRQPVNWAHVAEHGRCTQTEVQRGGGASCLSRLLPWTWPWAGCRLPPVPEQRALRFERNMEMGRGRHPSKAFCQAGWNHPLRRLGLRNIPAGLTWPRDRGKSSPVASHSTQQVPGPHRPRSHGLVPPAPCWLASLAPFAWVGLPPDTARAVPPSRAACPVP